MKTVCTGVGYAQGRRRSGHLYLGLRYRTWLVQKHLKDGDRVLDLGAADGGMMNLLSEMINLSLRVSLEANPELAALISHNAVCGNALALPFAENTFDFVICSAIRKHVRNSRVLMSEIARVLKPSGRVAVIDPHPLLLKLGLLLGKFDPRYLYHASFASEVRREIISAGLHPQVTKNHIFIFCVGQKECSRTA